MASVATVTSVNIGARRSRRTTCRSSVVRVMQPDTRDETGRRRFFCGADLLLRGRDRDVPEAHLAVVALEHQRAGLALERAERPARDPLDERVHDLLAVQHDLQLAAD